MANMNNATRNLNRSSIDVLTLPCAGNPACDMHVIPFAFAPVCNVAPLNRPQNISGGSDEAAADRTDSRTLAAREVRQLGFVQLVQGDSSIAAWLRGALLFDVRNCGWGQADERTDLRERQPSGT